MMLCYQVCVMLPAQRNLLSFPTGHQVWTTFPSQTTLLFFPQQIIKWVPHFNRRQPCFFSLPTRSSTVCDASNTKDLAFFSQQIIKCVRYFQHRQRTRLSLAALKKIPTRKYKKGNSRTLVQDGLHSSALSSSIQSSSSNHFDLACPGKEEDSCRVVLMFRRPPVWLRD